MKKKRIQFLQWLVQVAGNHRRARLAAQAVLFLELAGVSWYNPLWHLRNTYVLFQRLWHVIRVEMKGHPSPIKHINPEVKICKDFSCIRSEDGRCSEGLFNPACNETCLGIRYVNGTAVPTTLDYYGKPVWQALTCRDCTQYLRTCKGLNPKYLKEKQWFDEENATMDNNVVFPNKGYLS